MENFDGDGPRVRDGQGNEAPALPSLWPRCNSTGAEGKSGRAGNEPEEWRRTVLVTNQGQLYVQPAYIFGCARVGAKFTTRKRGTLQPLVAGTLQILDDRILIDRWLPKGKPPVGSEKDPLYLDAPPVVNAVPDKGIFAAAAAESRQSSSIPQHRLQFGRAYDSVLPHQ